MGVSTEEADLGVTVGSPVLLLCCPRVRGVTRELEGMAVVTRACSSRSHPEMEAGAGLRPKGACLHCADALFPEIASQSSALSGRSVSEVTV